MIHQFLPLKSPSKLPIVLKKVLHRQKRLQAWRKTIEAKFRFDPAKGIDPSDIAALNNKFKILKKQLEEHLAKGINELQLARNTTLRRRTELSAQLERAANEFAKAQADAKLL